ncbi:MAG TPA: OmpW family outer membrane protein [Thermoanaerobaculia bacterium]|nr:OmpW family outer membrane protein [Thermoanaerobaculia bacterium]
MNRFIPGGLLVALLIATPVAAQSQRLSILGGAQFVQRTGMNEFREDVVGTQFDVTFDAGGGVGFGFNYFLSDHLSIEAKSSLVESTSSLRIRTSSDSIAILKLGRTRTYPSTAVLQYHFATKGDLRPYIGAGGAYTFVKDVETAVGKIEFEQESGLVVNAGFDVRLSDQWAVNLDAKYVPLETSAKAVSTNAADLRIKPIIFFGGLRYKF